MNVALTPMSPDMAKTFMAEVNGPIIDRNFGKFMGAWYGGMASPGFFTGQGTPGAESELVHPLLFQQGYVPVGTAAEKPTELDMKALERIIEHMVPEFEKALERALTKYFGGGDEDQPKPWPGGGPLHPLLPTTGDVS